MSTYYINAYNKKRKIAIPVEEKWMCCNFDFDVQTGTRICDSNYDDLSGVNREGVLVHEGDFNSEIVIPHASPYIIDSSKITVIDYWNAIKLETVDSVAPKNYKYQSPSALLKPSKGTTSHTRIGDKINIKTITYGLLFTLKNSDYVQLQWNGDFKTSSSLLEKVTTNYSNNFMIGNDGSSTTQYTLQAAKDLLNFVYSTPSSTTDSNVGLVNQRINPNMKFNFRLFVVEFDEKYNIASKTASQVNDLIIDWYKTVFKHNTYFPSYITQSNKISVKEESNKYAGEFIIKLDKSFKLTSSKPYKYLDLSFAVNQNCELRKVVDLGRSTIDDYRPDDAAEMYINKWANTLMFVISPCLYTTDIDPSTYHYITSTNMSPTVSVSGNAKMIFYDV